MLNPFIHDSRHKRKDTKNIFSSLRFIILCIYLPWVYSGVFSLFILELFVCVFIFNA